MDYSLQYYDLVLLAIGASLAVGAGVGTLTSVPLEVSMTLLGVVGVGIVGHALFVRGPVDEVDDLTEPVEPEKVPGGGVLEPVAD